MEDSVEAWQWAGAMLALRSQALHPEQMLLELCSLHMKSGACSCHRSCSFPSGDRLCHLWNIMTQLLWDIPAQGTADIVWRNGCLAYTELMFCACVCMCNRMTIDKINTINKIKKSDHRRA